MTEREKEIAERLTMAISKMSETSRTYFLGFGEGLTYRKETEEMKTA